MQHFELESSWFRFLMSQTGYLNYKTACLTKSEYSLGGMIINIAFDTVLKNSAIKGVTT